MGQVRSKKLFPETIIHKIFETGSLKKSQNITTMIVVGVNAFLFVSA